MGLGIQEWLSIVAASLGAIVTVWPPKSEWVKWLVMPIFIAVAFGSGIVARQDAASRVAEQAERDKSAMSRDEAAKSQLAGLQQQLSQQVELIIALGKPATRQAPDIQLADIYPESWGGRVGSGHVRLDDKPHQMQSGTASTMLTPCVVASESLFNVWLALMIPKSFAVKLSNEKLWQTWPRADGGTNYLAYFKELNPNDCTVNDSMLLRPPSDGTFTLRYQVSGRGERGGGFSTPERPLTLQAHSIRP